MKKLPLLLLLLVLAITPLDGKDLPVQNFVVGGSHLMGFSGTELAFSFNMMGIDANNLPTLNTSERKTSCKNLVALVLKDHALAIDSFKVSIEADLNYSMIDRPEEIKTKIALEINYRDGELLKSAIEHVYAFENAYAVTLSITKVEIQINGDKFAPTLNTQPHPELVALIQDAIEVNVSFAESRKTRLDYSVFPTGLDACEDKSTDELVIYWDARDDAEGYELEYTFVDDYTSVKGQYKVASHIWFDFKENSTRVTTKETNYRFPLVAEQGYFLYRIRAIGYGDPNLKILVRGMWSQLIDKGFVSGFGDRYHHRDAHMEDGMNWQSSTTFAEDGKRSDVVTYLDGRFSTRQQVTAMNLEPQLPEAAPASGLTVACGSYSPQTCTPPQTNKVREVIAGETIYDFQGRPAVNILPAPTNGKRLEFINNLNLAHTDQQPYNWTHFDAGPTACEIKTDSLYPKPFGYSCTIGAAVYYSPNNPDKLGFNAFIPDAAMFPFTQVRYLSDNTGRVAAQGGVGKTFQLGSGHETKFYYAAPDQVELDRMFGTEAGDAKRYQKNAVRDPNGQISVTYLNPEGKTIATALAGACPLNLDTLPNRESSHVIVSLTNKNDTIETDHSLVLEHQFLVSYDSTEYMIEYSLDPEMLQYVFCGDTVCLDCIYDFSISLTHNESCTQIPIIARSGTIGELNNVAGEVDTNCDNGSTADTSRKDTVMLGIGTYTLSKTLRVNEAAALAYVAEVFKDTCMDKWNELLLHEMNKVDTMDCYSNCLDCALPPLPTDTCDTAYCKPAPNRCDVIKAMMYADMSLGGQYAQCDFLPNGRIDAGIYPLSIFNPNNLLPGSPQLGEILVKLGLDSKTSWSTLAMNWKAEYGEKLVEFHPEHCLLGWCEEPGIDQTLDFDMKILSLEFFGDALKEKLVPICSLVNCIPKPYELLLNADPFFENGKNAAKKEELRQKLENYGCENGKIPADEVAIRAAYCAKRADFALLTGTTPAIDPTGSKCTGQQEHLDNHKFGSDTAYADLEWQMLRALYLSAKNEVLEQHQRDWVKTHGNRCNARCIGAENYSYLAPIYMQSGYEPCESPNSFCWVLYRDKQSRFSTGIDQLMKGWADEGIPFDASQIKNFDDPCDYMKAILAQRNAINSAVAANYCGEDTLRCALPSAQLIALKEYLNSIFNFKTAYQNYPTGEQLLRMLPPALQKRNNKSIDKVSIRSSNPFEIKFEAECPQPDPWIIGVPIDWTPLPFGPNSVVPSLPAQPIRRRRGNRPPLPSLAQPGSVQQPSYTHPFFMAIQTLMTNYQAPVAASPCDSCKLSLSSSGFYIPWDHVKRILSITPKTIPGQHGPSNSFTMTVLFGHLPWEMYKTEITGTLDCWITNNCPQNGEVIRPMLCDSLPPDTVPQPSFRNECVESMLRIARSNAQLRYRQWEDSLKADLLKKYYAKCMQAKETFDLKYIDLQYHYTLYYYDQAGNLVKTVPPAGVNLLANAQVAAVQASRDKGYATRVLPTHFKQTHYHYNTLNELVWQRTPDAGESVFFYDGLGRIVASQNAQQKPDGNFHSYSRYDVQGRMIQTGKMQSNLITPAKARDFEQWSTFIDGLTTRSEITQTQYDRSWSPLTKYLFQNNMQENLRQRVASVLKFDTQQDFNSNSYSHATHYTYDIAGNVKELIQDFKNGIIGAKSIAYDFDLQSGKVNEVIYQAGMPDQFIHRYSYDAANRLTQVETTRDRILWETDATYLYYRHGPLARIELGSDKVQGLDYIYTLQGWIKGVNGTTETAEFDIGHDGVAMQYQVPNLGAGGDLQTPVLNTPPPGYRDLHHPIAKDAFGYVLSYFNGDFSPIEWGATGFANGTPVSFRRNPCLDGMPQPNAKTEALYNGNISQMYTQIQGLGNNGFDYSYDQLNRITDSEAWNIDVNGTVSMLPNTAYRGTWKYDADGNILNQFRNGKQGEEAMDDMQYRYYRTDGHSYDPQKGIPANATNRLAHVFDILIDNPADDIENQDSLNYTYDLIGNLISDEAENIDQITWNLQNKVAAIEKSVGADLVFEYDGLGNRIEKTVTNGADAENASTYYVRDAQGNIMATYSYRVPVGSSSTAEVLSLEELDIYGSSRIGMNKVGLVMDLPSNGFGTIDNSYVGYIDGQGNFIPAPRPPKGQYLLRTRGEVCYELPNHLGNVLAVVSDRKLPVAEPAGTYVADVLSAQDYYAFGMVMPGRSLEDRTDGYRYGFNGMEGDDEVKSKGNSYTTEFRQYDPRLGRWLSLDPLVKNFPWQSPYAGFDNDPICYHDPKGKAAEEVNKNGFDKPKKSRNEIAFKRKLTRFIRRNNLENLDQKSKFDRFSSSRNLFGKVRGETKWFKNYLNSPGKSNATNWTPSAKQIPFIITVESDPTSSSNSFEKTVDLKSSQGQLEVNYDMNGVADLLILSNPNTGEVIFTTNGPVTQENGSGRVVPFNLGQGNTQIVVEVNPPSNIQSTSIGTDFSLNLKVTASTVNSESINGLEPKPTRKERKAWRWIR